MKSTGRFPFILIAILTIVLSVGCPKQGNDNPQAENPSADNPTGEIFALTILHTNDSHGRIQQINDHGNVASEAEITSGRVYGGVARRATEVLKYRDGERHVLLLDGGDQFQGTLFYSHYKGLGAQTFMNMMRYDAMTLGNHEFDDGDEVLSNFISGLNFPVLSSNIDASNSEYLADLIVPYTVIEIEGRKIGLTGYTTADTPSISNPGPDLIFNNTTESMRNVVSELESQEIDIIIALSHAGLNADKDMAAAVGGLDIIVGGHTHTLLSNSHPDSEGQYPVVVDSPDSEPVLIVQAGSLGKFLGHLEVEFDENGIATEWSGDPILLNNTVPEDQEAAMKVAEMAAPVAQLGLVTIGETQVDLEGREEYVRHGESNLGDLICDALMWEAGKNDVDFAIFNGGGIRSGIQQGEITMANVLEVLPFGDTLATFELTGADVLEMFEYGVSRAEDPHNEGTGRFLQVSHAKYTWDVSKPVGERIVELKIDDGTGNYEPVDPEGIYKIVTLLYIREGGDGYEILEERAINPYDFGRNIADILVEYIVMNEPIAPVVEGRITKVS
jgi:5'-nucleotidase